METKLLHDLRRQQMESARRRYDGHGKRTYAVSGRQQHHRRHRRRVQAWVRVMLRWMGG